jgi:hypothetical protein
VPQRAQVGTERVAQRHNPEAYVSIVSFESFDRIHSVQVLIVWKDDLPSHG